jgi:hypothetical protein
MSSLAYMSLGAWWGVVGFKYPLPPWNFCLLFGKNGIFEGN